MVLRDLFVSVIAVHALLAFILAPIILLLLRSLYRIYFHPLSHIAGPLLPKVASLWLYYHAYIGDEASTIHKLHQYYGPYVRVSHKEVDISDADAVPAIYVSKGGFPKAACYANSTSSMSASTSSTRASNPAGMLFDSSKISALLTSLMKAPYCKFLDESMHTLNCGSMHNLPLDRFDALQIQ
jgi:hypothetical protein